MVLLTNLIFSALSLGLVLVCISLFSIPTHTLYLLHSSSLCGGPKSLIVYQDWKSAEELDPSLGHIRGFQRGEESDSLVKTSL